MSHAPRSFFDEAMPILKSCYHRKNNLENEPPRPFLSPTSAPKQK